MRTVSVIVPVYNSEFTLKRCIESVLAQDYDGIELVIVDDGSTDHSLSIASAYKSKKVRVYIQENRGACAARNFGLQRANGYYVKFLDADDFLEPGSITRQVEFAENLGPDLIPYGYSKVLDGSIGVFRKVKLPRHLQDIYLINNNLTITLPLHRKAALQSIGFFDESLSFRQEWDLHLRLVNMGYRFEYHDDCVFTQFIGPSNDRISSRKLSYKDEIINLNLIRDKYNICHDSELAAAWSYKYWTLARQFLKCSREEEAEAIFRLARQISPKGFNKNMPIYYRVIVGVFGVVKAEVLISKYSICRATIFKLLARLGVTA